MKKLISIVICCVLFSCATQPESPTVQLLDSKTYDAIQEEVNKCEWEVKHSLPELKYVRENHSPFGRALETVELRSSGGEVFQVLTLNCPSMDMPGEDFMLSYLKNPHGKIVHWKSCWLYNRLGNLGTKLLDVNHDGVKEFCFISKPFKGPEQILSAYCVRNEKFDPVIAKQVSYFTVEFTESVLPNGLLIKPQLEGKYGWETGKLYEIPIRVSNRSVTSKELRGCNLRFSPSDFYGAYFFCGFTTNTLAPDATLDATMTVRFSQGVRDQKFGFVIEEYKERP